MNTKFSLYKGELLGGITSAIVALPLALAFGVASGAGPASGIYSAIFVGFWASLFGGTPPQISGPTGPMTVVFTAIIISFMQSHPESGLLLSFSVVVMAGLFQILFGTLKLGKYISLVPYPVLSGVMTAVGILIIITEIPAVVGVHLDNRSATAVLSNIQQLISNTNSASLILASIAFGLVTLVPKRISSYCPSPLIAIVVGTILPIFFFQNSSFEMIGEIPRTLPVLHIPVIEVDIFGDMLKYALILAILGSIDSLMTSVIVDNLTRKTHRSDKELIGQGVGNIMAGLFGALPGAGATMRTVLNIKVGGKTNLSGMLHALILLTIVLSLAPLAEQVPQAVLAGILIHVGLSIIDWEFIKTSYRFPASKIFIMALVVLISVFIDLISAVTFGIILTSLITVRKLSEFQIGIISDSNSDVEFTKINSTERRILKQIGDKIVIFDINGPLIFSASQFFKQKFTSSSDKQIIMIDFTNVGMIDITMSMVIKGFIQDVHKDGGVIILVGLNPKTEKILSIFNIFSILSPKYIFKSREEGLRAALDYIAH